MPEMWYKIKCAEAEGVEPSKPREELLDYKSTGACRCPTLP